MNYLQIVLNGFVSNRKYLTDYFIRQFREAESENYSLGEFFNGCLNIVSALNYDLKKKYYADMKEYQECLHHAITINDKDAENQFREQLKKIDEYDYSVTLYSFTGGKFTGHLFSDEIKYIALSLNDAFDKLQEQTPATNQSELKTEIDLIRSNIETVKSFEPENPFPRIFPNGKCWQLFEHWRNEVKGRTQLAELSFIYRQMQKDGLIHEYIKPTEFREWLLKTFDIELEPLKQLSNCNGGNKYSRYQTAKLLFQC